MANQDEPGQTTGVHIGNKVNGESLGALTGCFIKIMGAKGDQETIRHAISELRRAANIGELSIGSITVTGVHTGMEFRPSDDEGSAAHPDVDAAEEATTDYPSA